MKPVSFHPLVEEELAEIISYYRTVSGARLADNLQHEFFNFIDLARSTPGRFHCVQDSVRRANLKRFPYHFLFIEKPDRIRVLVVRHHSRHPTFGIDRT